MEAEADHGMAAMRIRTIKPDFWKHEDLSRLPEPTHMLAAALLNYADDEGYFNANPRLVQSECFPLREPSVNIHESLLQLQSVGYLRLGNGVDGRAYGHVVHFLDHQRVSHPYPSKIKELEIVWDDSVNLHGQFTEHSALNRKGKGKGKRKGKGILGADAPQKRSTQIPQDWKPSAGNLEKLKGKGFQNSELVSELEGFRDFHQSKGSVFKDWEAAFRTWMRNSRKFANGGGRAKTPEKPYSPSGPKRTWAEFQQEKERGP